MNSRQRRKLEAARHNKTKEQETREKQAAVLFNWFYRVHAKKKSRKEINSLMALMAGVAYGTRPHVNVGTIGHVDQGRLHRRKI